MSNNTTSLPTSLVALSNYVLKTQYPSNVVWLTLCVMGLIMSLLQIATTLMWKPLRNIEQSLVLAIAAGDVIKAAGFGTFITRRLILMAVYGQEIITQRLCVAWLLNLSIPSDFVGFLLIAVSAERLLGQLVPVWYKFHKISLKIFLITISFLAGVLSGCIILISTDANLYQSVCVFATSPTIDYQKYASGMKICAITLTLSINVTSCLFVLIRWRAAVKQKKDMKTFKNNIQLKALKTLLAVVALYLVSNVMGTVWAPIVNLLPWTDAMRMSNAPLGACFALIRGVLDFPIYLLMVREYRRGFVAVILRRKPNAIEPAPVSAQRRVSHL